MAQRLVITCSGCGKSWDMDRDPPACTCESAGCVRDEWRLAVVDDEEA